MNLKKQNSLIYKVPIILGYTLSILFVFMLAVDSISLQLKDTLTCFMLGFLSISIIVTSLREFFYYKNKGSGYLFLIGGVTLLLVAIASFFIFI